MSEAYEALRGSGLRATPHRLQVFRLLTESRTALSAEELYQRLRTTNHGINRSTVYRILEAFVEKKLITRSLVPEDPCALYEVNTEEHCHYLTCTGCRRRVPIDACPLNRLEKELTEKTGFTINSHRLEVFGTCPACAHKK